MADRPRIACVFAHPDDETFCVGGIIAKYADRGAVIDVFCATNGGAGKAAGVPVSSRDELAALRRAEAKRAGEILGIASLEMPGYPDGQLSTVDASTLTGDIVAFIRRTRPVVVIGFGPEGAPTGHRDHAAMSRATMAAFFLAGLRTAYPAQGLEPFAPRRLYFHAWRFPLPDPRLQIESVPSTCAIDVREWKPRKEAAFQAHATQQGSAPAFYAGAFNDEEHLAFAAGEPQPQPMVDDLFAGL